MGGGGGVDSFFSPLGYAPLSVDTTLFVGSQLATHEKGRMYS